jgi:hypothetical protein
MAEGPGNRSASQPRRGRRHVGIGSGLSRTLLTTLRTAAFAPMPIASVTSAAVVNRALVAAFCSP